MLNHKKKVILTTILIIISISVIGCWNYDPIKERSIVIAVGLDKTKADKIELSLQIANPALIKPDQIIQENAVTIVSDNGDTVFEAVRNIIKRVNRKTYYGHLQLIVIGEELAKDNIEEVLDFFERDHEPRLTPYVIVSKGLSAKKVLEAKSTLSYIPAMHIKDTIDNTKGSGKIERITLIEILKQINYPEYNPTVGVIDGTNREEVKRIADMKVEGTGVFKRTRMVGYLDGIETRALAFIKNTMQGGLIRVKSPVEKNKFVSIEVIRSKSNIKVEFKSDQPYFIVEVETKCSLGGQQGKGDLTTQVMLLKLENEVKNTIKNEINHTIKKVQKEYESDILGFAEVISKKYPYYWEKEKNNWNSIFQDVPVEVKVNIQIKRNGLINKTTEAQ